MTVCAVVKLNDAIIAVADGRITAGEQLSLDTVEKIVEIQPTYKIPVISKGRIDHFSDYRGPKWFVAYAGTYALCNDVINSFRQSVTQLYLCRDDKTRTPFLSAQYDRADSYSDDYNFTAGEEVAFSAYVMTDFFRETLKRKADEWLRNRREISCEFIMFGDPQGAYDQNERYPAYHLGLDLSRDKSQVEVTIKKAKPYELICIGDAPAVNEIIEDKQLQSDIRASEPKASVQADELEQWLSLTEASSTTAVEQRLLSLIQHMNVISVGGQVLVGTGRQGGTIKFKRL